MYKANWRVCLYSKGGFKGGVYPSTRGVILYPYRFLGNFGNRETDLSFYKCIINSRTLVTINQVIIWVISAAQKHLLFYSVKVKRKAEVAIRTVCYRLCGLIEYIVFSSKSVKASITMVKSYSFKITMNPDINFTAKKTSICFAFCFVLHVYFLFIFRLFWSSIKNFISLSRFTRIHCFFVPKTTLTMHFLQA